MFKSKPFYWITCDDCDESAQKNSDYAAWAEPESACYEATESGWTEKDGKHWCEECSPKHADADEDES